MTAGCWQFLDVHNIDYLQFTSVLGKTSNIICCHQYENKYMLKCPELFNGNFYCFYNFDNFFMMFKLNVDFLLGQSSFDWYYSSCQSSSVSSISKQMFNESVLGLFKIK